MKKKTLDYILRIYLPVTLVVAFVTFVTTYYVSQDERNGVGYAPEQPIKFSHKLHAGQMKIDCRYCHQAANKARHSTIPSVDTCMNCHSQVKKTSKQTQASEEIKKLTKYFEDGKPIPWKRIHRVPGHVYFNHSVHINKGLQCVDCHGNVHEMEVVKLDRKWPAVMADCLKCHREATERFPELVSSKGLKNGPEHCAACHR